MKNQIQTKTSSAEHLIDNIKSMLENSRKDVLSNQCRKHKFTSIEAIQVLKYIIPKLSSTTRIEVEYVEWLHDTKIIGAVNREKYLKRISKEERSEFEKYRVGREIKIRKQFKNKNKEYQDKRLQLVYVNSLYRYLKDRGYHE